MDRSSGWFRALRWLLALALALGFAALAAWLGYRSGFSDGRMRGREDAALLSGIARPTPQAFAAVPIASPPPEQPAPTEAAVDLCDSLAVVPQELLVRAEPDLAAGVTSALAQGAAVRVVCNSEQMLHSVSWVQVASEQSGGAQVLGWVPGQDVGFPPLCEQATANGGALVLRQRASDTSDPVRELPAGTELRVVCGSAHYNAENQYRVRVQAVVDGEIVLGWADADVVLGAR